MKIFLQTLTAFIALIFFGACQKDVNTFVVDKVNLPDTVWHSSITASMPVVSLKNDLRLAERVDNFTFNNTDIIYANGIITLAAGVNTLVSTAGNVITGNITQRTLLLQKKGDIIRMDMPTVSNDRLMVSGGSFFLDLKKGNDSIVVPQNKKITLKYNSSISAPGMVVYNATGNQLSGYNWLPNTDLVNNNVTLTGTGFEVAINKTQWVQTAYLFDTTGIPQTKLSVKLPSNYTNANTEVFLVFNDMYCVSSLKADAASRLFQTGDVPANRSVTMVIISKQSGDYYFAQQQVFATVASQNLNITPVKRSFEYVVSYLNSL